MRNQCAVRNSVLCEQFISPRTTPGCVERSLAMKAQTTAYEYALNLLAARAYTVRNLRRKLAQKGFDATESDAAIERLRVNGYVDDAKYAVEFARQRLVVGGASVRRVEQELVKRGIARESARAALQGVVEEENVDTAASIERLARKKLASLGDLEPFVKRRRVFGFLARRGYEVDEINRVLGRICP